MSEEEVTLLYGRDVVDLRNHQRYKFANTLFDVSEGTLYMQLVERLDDGTLKSQSLSPFSAEKCNSYSQLYRACSNALFHAHVDGDLKAEISQVGWGGGEGRGGFGRGLDKG